MLHWHDMIRFMSCYPTLKEVTLAPTAEQVYEQETTSTDTKMSARKKRDFYENPMWMTPVKEHLEPYERYIENPPTPISNQNARLLMAILRWIFWQQLMFCSRLMKMYQSCICYSGRLGSPES